MGGDLTRWRPSDTYMSIRENLEISQLLDLKQYTRILLRDFGAEKHPVQEDALVLNDQPFYSPRSTGDHISILSFNYAPLPYSLVKALIEHPELVSDYVIVTWTQEQDLVWQGTLGELRRRYSPYRTRRARTAS
jgi:hypothetical protein